LIFLSSSFSILPSGTDSGYMGEQQQLKPKKKKQKPRLS